MAKATSGRYLLGLALLVAAVSFVATQDPPDPTGQGDDPPTLTGAFDFLCSRKGAVCYQENSTCEYNGICTCVDGYEGYDCSVNMNMTCEKECQNDGTCTLNEDEEEVCQCTEAYMGELCELPRVSHTCSQQGMMVTMSPPVGMGGEFQGDIAVKYTGPMSAECELVESEPGVYSGMIPYDTCGGAYAFNNTDDKLVKGFTFLVMFDSGILTALDASFDLYCIFPNSGEIVEDELLVIAAGANQTEIKKGKLDEAIVPVMVEALQADGSPVDPEYAYPLGEEITLKFTLKNGTTYGSFIVVDITTHNGAEEATELQLVSEGCALADRDYIVNEFSAEENGTVKIFKHNVFQFRGYQRVAYRFKIKVCAVGREDQCNATECEGDEFLTGEGFEYAHGRRRRAAGQELEDGGRRRRAAGQEEEEDGVTFTELETTLFVRGPPSTLTQDLQLQGDSTHFRRTHHDDVTNPSPEVEECLCNLTFVIIIVVLAVLLVVMASLCFLYLLKNRDNRRRKSQDNLAYSN